LKSAVWDWKSAVWDWKSAVWDWLKNLNSETVIS